MAMSLQLVILILRARGNDVVLPRALTMAVGGKKKKESKKKETLTVPSSSTPTEGTLQQLVPVGLDAFAKDQVVVE